MLTTYHPGRKVPWPGYTTRIARKNKKRRIFPTILGQEAPSFRKRYRQKEEYLNMAYFPDDFGLRSGSPSFRKPYRQKEVYLIMAYLRRFWVKEPCYSKNVIARKGYTLNMAYLRRFWVKEPRHSKNVIARKRYTLIWRIYDDFGSGAAPRHSEIFFHHEK